MTKTALLMCLLNFLPQSQPAGPADKVFDIKQILLPPLQARTLKTTEANGIVTEEVMFHSETDGAKKVEIFAYFSYPKGAKKLPGLIWNQGGLYQATTYWTEFGAKRGYATLCIDFPLPGYRSGGGYPITSGLELGDDPKQAPIYHGAVALLRAVSYLESRPEVDADRIGMAGSSWGGFYTTLMAGLDPRLKAASSMFGSGGLQLGNAWWDGSGWDSKRTKEFRDRWQTTLDPAGRLAQAKTPVAWFTGTNDHFYWLPAVMESHKTAVGPKHLSLLPNWNHALTPTLDEQVFAWLDVHLKGATPFLTVTPLEIDGQVAQWKFDGPREVKSADLMLSYGKPGNWRGRYWSVLPAKIDGKVCSVRLPDGEFPFSISGSVTDANGFRYSTAVRLVDPAGLGFAKKANLLNYDGCSLWGGFEPEQITNCQLHGWPVAPVTGGAKQGNQCAVLKAGTWTSPPVLGTTGVPHRLTGYLRGDVPAKVSVTIDGSFDGKKVQTTKQMDVTADWQPFTLEFTLPDVLTMTVQVFIAVPKGATLQIDEIRFQPMNP